MANYSLSASEAYKRLISEISAAKGAAVAPVASEFGDVVNIYKTGGEYGAGARAAATEAAKKGLASSQAALVASGMSSGSLATGARARYSRDLTQQLQNIEDVRYERLGAALSQLASAKEARGLRVAQAGISAAGIYESIYGTETEKEVAQQRIRAEELNSIRSAGGGGRTTFETPFLSNYLKSLQPQASSQRYI